MISNVSEYIPLYQDLINNKVASVKYDLYPFFTQVGKNYFSSQKRILFVGKSVNGWITNDRNVSNLFDINNQDRIVNRSDQMEWVNKLSGSNKVYNTNQSAFWRVIKKVSENITQDKCWFNNVAWTNLYKVSPKKLNPNTKLKNMQLSTAKKILLKDINILDPSVVVFLTSGWDDPFLKNTKFQNPKTDFIGWGKYKTFYQKIESKVLIYSLHPQGKKETLHKDAILKIIKELT